MAESRFDWGKAAAIFVGVVSAAGAVFLPDSLSNAGRVPEIAADVDASYLDLDLRHEDDVQELHAKIRELRRTVRRLEDVVDELSRVNLLTPDDVPGIWKEGGQ